MLSELLTSPLKYIVSRLYRFFLAICSIVLILGWNKYELNPTVVILIGAAWMACFKVKTKRLDHAYLRMFLDSILLGCTILASLAPEYFKMAFVLFPILNQHNHSSNPKSAGRTVVFFCLWSACFFLVASPNHYFSLTIYSFVFFMVVIDWIESYLRRLSEDLERITYDIIDATEESRKVSDLLGEIIRMLSSKFGPSFQVRDIYVIEEKQGKSYLRVGTKYNPFLELYPESNPANDYRPIVNVAVRDSGSIIEQTARGIKVPYSDRNFFFVLVYDGPIRFNFLNAIITHLILRKAAANIIRLILRKRQRQMIEKKIRNELILNNNYIYSVRAAAHFIKNSGTPFNTLHTMVADFLSERATVLPQEVGAANQQARATHKRIQEYVERILNSPKKDIFSEDPVPVSLEKLLKTINSIIEENGVKIKPNFQLNVSSIGAQMYAIKLTSFSILIENLITNSSKHSSGEQGLGVSFSNEKILISVSNKIKQNCVRDVRRFVSDINSSTKEEILKRSGEGLLLIRNACESLGFKLSASLDDANENISIQVESGDINA